MTALVPALLGLAVGPPVMAEEKKPAPSPLTTRWTQIEAATGRMNLDGTLRLNFPMGESSELKQLGVHCELEHRIETDAQGGARSVWRINGLQSCLVPSGRDQLLWQPLAGPPVKFERAKIGRALSEAGSPRWRIREAGSDDYEIRSLDGRAWHYAHGGLVSAYHPALGDLRFETRGAWVTAIRRVDAVINASPLIAASYDENGRLASWVMGAEKPQRLTRSETGQLQTWQRADGSEVRFTYRDSLLCEVAEPGKPEKRFAWVENPGHERGDSRWAAAVHLASDGEDRYMYELTSQGFVLRRTNATGGEILTVFNPRRHRLEQRKNGETLIVAFHSGIAGMTALERIQTGQGEILEDYRYDEHDQLVAVKRQGERERLLSYDESGRLMTLEESGVP